MPLHPIDNRSRNRRQNLWVGCVSSWWPLFPSRSFVNIYIYAFFIWVLLYDVYIYIQQECHSVLVKLHPITLYRTVFLGSARFLGWMPLFVFFGLPIVSCSLINSLVLGCLWLMVFVLNNTLILGIWCSTIPHLPGCFCPWTFFQNIRFNMVPSDPFMSHLATQLGYSAESFQALQLIVLAVFGVVDLPPACWSTFWKSTFKQQLGCRFDIMDSISSFFLYFDICNYIWVCPSEWALLGILAYPMFNPTLWFNC